MMPGLSTAKLIGFALGAAAILSFVLLAFHWRSSLADRDHQITAACDATRTASNRPKLDCKQMAQQITFLGDALNDVRAKTEAAQAEDAAHAQTVETNQNTISKESSNDYQTAIAAVRADYAERLRKLASQAAAHSGSGSKPPVPDSASSPPRSDAASAQAQLPAADSLTATEQAIQLLHLEEWVCNEGLAAASVCALLKPATAP